MSLSSKIRYIPFFASFAHATFPFPEGGPSAELKTDNEVTFDPLAVAAVLPNERADLSAAKLYLRLDDGVYNWPHTMMIGGTLPPIHTFAAHLSMGYTSIHPAITLCGKAIKFLQVRSDMIFKELPFNLGNYRLNDLVEFRSSERPGNDFMVVNVDGLEQSVDSMNQSFRPGRLTLDLIGLLTGLLLFLGLSFGVLTADIWASTLFGFYVLHWVASTLVSFTPMIRFGVKGVIVPDDSPRYAVYQRPEAGTVVFKGRKDTLERWARGTLEFNKTPRATIVHWFWMTSGTAASIASVACMVNMRGYMQLGFLAVLVYSSLAEILATQVSRNLQIAARGEIPHQLVGDNVTRTSGIIRATVEVPPACRLVGLNWIKLELLPNWPVYDEMLKLLARVNEIQDHNRAESHGTESAAEIEAAIREFLARTTADKDLSERIANETRAAWRAGQSRQSEGKEKVDSGDEV